MHSPQSEQNEAAQGVGRRLRPLTPPAAQPFQRRGEENDAAQRGNEDAKTDYRHFAARLCSADPWRVISSERF